MWDGHTALEQGVVKGPVNQDGFYFCLTYARLADGRRFFVFHIASEEPFSERAQRWLELMGLQEFGSCPHFDQRPCFWKAMEAKSLHSDPWGHLQQVDFAHRAFDRLCEDFPKALRKLESASEVLAEIGLSL